MFLVQAEGGNFRNFHEFSLPITSKISVFTGQNGHGKSSFLEAVFAGLRGKSFRPGAGSRFISHHKNSAFARLSFRESHGLSRVEAFFSRRGGAPAGESGGFPPLDSQAADGQNKEAGQLEKELLFCGKKTGPAALEKRFPALVFTEEKMQAIREGPGERRLFTDDMLLQAGRRAELARLKKNLREKSSLLKSLKEGDIPLSGARRALEALNGAFLKAAEAVAAARLEILERLFAGAGQISPKLFAGPRDLGFEYLTAGENLRGKPEKIRCLLERDLEEKADREILAGRPLSGPQHHDIVFSLGGRDSRAFCSKGQQRLLIFSLLGSQALNLHAKGSPPALLLLDDALGELDEESQKRFLRFLDEAPCQALLTSCAAPPIKTKNMSLFSVSGGKIISL